MNKVTKVINYTFITLSLTFLPIAINYFHHQKSNNNDFISSCLFYIFKLLNFEISAKLKS